MSTPTTPVAKARKRAGLTQAELADRAVVQPNYLPPTARYAAAREEAFGISRMLWERGGLAGEGSVAES